VFVILFFIRESLISSAFNNKADLIFTSFSAGVEDLLLAISSTCFCTLAEDFFVEVFKLGWLAATWLNNLKLYE